MFWTTASTFAEPVEAAIVNGYVIRRLQKKTEGRWWSEKEEEEEKGERASGVLSDFFFYLVPRRSSWGKGKIMPPLPLIFF